MDECEFREKIQPYTVSELTAASTGCRGARRDLERKYRMRKASSIAATRKAEAETDPKKKRVLERAAGALADDCRSLEQEMKDLNNAIDILRTEACGSLFNHFVRPCGLDERFFSSRPEVSKWVPPVLNEATAKGRNLARVVKNIVPKPLQKDVQDTICEHILLNTLPTKYVPEEAGVKWPPPALEIISYLKDAAALTDTTVAEFARTHPREAYRCRLVLVAILMERELMDLAKQCRGEEPFTEAVHYLRGLDLSEAVDAICRVFLELHSCSLKPFIQDFAAGKLRDPIPVPPSFIAHIKAESDDPESVSDEMIHDIFNREVGVARFCGAVSLAAYKYARGMDRLRAARFAEEATGVCADAVLKSLLTPDLDAWEP